MQSVVWTNIIVMNYHELSMNSSIQIELMQIND